MHMSMTMFVSGSPFQSLVALRKLAHKNLPNIILLPKNRFSYSIKSTVTPPVLCIAMFFLCDSATWTQSWQVVIMKLIRNRNIPNFRKYFLQVCKTLTY